MPDINGTAQNLGVTPATISGWQEEGAPVPDDAADFTGLKGIASWVARRCDVHDREAASAFSPAVLNGGFLAGIALCFLVMIAMVIYLFTFLVNTNSGLASLEVTSWKDLSFLAVTLRLVTIKLGLASCGILTGSGLAFLGMSLFLIGVRGSMNVDGNGGGFGVKLVNVAPGTLVLLCSAALIGFCSTREVSLTGPEQQIAAAGGSASNSGAGDGIIASGGVAKFNAAVGLAEKLKATIESAAAAPSDQRKSQLRQVWYFADTSLGLVNEYRAALGDVSGNAKVAEVARRLDALKKLLVELSKTESGFDSNPEEKFKTMREALGAFEKQVAQ